MTKGFLWALQLVACSSPTPTVPVAPPVAHVNGTEGGGCSSAVVSFQSDIIPIFAADCSMTTLCHGQMDNGAEENLYLGQGTDETTNTASDIAAAYSGIVNVKSKENPSMNLVSEGNLDNSYLWHKVVGDQDSNANVAAGCQTAAETPDACADCTPALPCGVQMPFTGGLDAGTVCAIQNWITQGAMNN